MVGDSLNFAGASLKIVSMAIGPSSSKDAGQTLDKDDPFEEAVSLIVMINRQKRADYALDGDPFSNFKFSAQVMGVEPEEAALFNVAQKLARLSSLRANRRGPQNEAVYDTYLDLAVYGVLAYAIYLNKPRGGEA